MANRREPQPPTNPKVRASFYGMAALYLAYLYFQIAKPFLTRDPYGPTTLQFVLGTAILGAGAVILALLAWKMYKTPVPPDEEDMESAGAPGDEDGDGGETEKKSDS